MKNTLFTAVLMLLSLSAIASCSQPSRKGPGEIRELEFSGLHIWGLGKSPKDLKEDFNDDGSWASQWPIQAKGDWRTQWDGSVCVTIRESSEEKYEGQIICRAVTEADGKSYFPSVYDQKDHIPVVLSRTVFVR